MMAGQSLKISLAHFPHFPQQEMVETFVVNIWRDAQVEGHSRNMLISASKHRIDRSDCNGHYVQFTMFNLL